MKVFISSTLLLVLVSCKTPPDFGPDQCLAMANLADSIAVRVAEVADPEKAPLVAEYSEIVKDLTAFGCTFFPEQELDD